MITIINSIGNFLNTNSGAVTAVATVLIAAFTVVLAVATRRIYRHTVASERAYVTMSHISPPGLCIKDGTSQVWVTIQVKNSGRTPATISNLVIKVKVLQSGTLLPESPDYGREQDEPTAKAFLATNSSFEHSRKLSVSDWEIDEVKNGTKALYVLGYVDYIDEFKQRHRGGYARRYDPIRDTVASEQRNNLVFVTQRGYNYDRPRKKWEGHDW